MAESQAINFQAFEPVNGGTGARLAVSTTTARVAIPGLEGGQQDDRSRIIITNPNSFSVFVRMGNASVVATLNSLEIIAGSSQLFKPPNIGPQALYMAAIAERAGGYASVCAGYGT